MINTTQNWQKVKIKDLLEYERPDKYIVESERYISQGVPVLTANKSFILGYTNENNGIYEKVPAIIFDDFTTDSKYVDFPFKVKSSAIKILKSKNSNVDLRFVFEKLKSINFPTGNHKRYYISQYQNMDVEIPPLPIQKRVVEVLLSVEETIQKTDQIIQKTEVLKQGLIRELLTKGIGHKKFKKTKLGEIPEEWKIVTMRDICSVRQGLQIAIRDRKPEPGIGRYLYLTNQYLKNPDKPEYIENPIKSVICSENDVLMTRTGNTGLVVTDVSGVFHNNFFMVDYDRSQIDKKYLVYFLQSEIIQRIILDRAGSTTIPDLNHGDFYSIPFILPSLIEQQTIANQIYLIDQKLFIERKQLKNLIIIKNGLMQDIFSQKVEIN